MASLSAVGGFLAKVMPWVGAAATGNVPALISMAAATVSKAVGKPVATSVESMSAAIAGATPEQLLALKTADNEFGEKMQAMGFADTETLAKVAADDRADARAREIALKDRVPAVLAIGITLGFFVLLGAMMFIQPPVGTKDLLNIMLGSLGAAWISVVTYYFGSSSGQDKMAAAGNKS